MIRRKTLSRLGLLAVVTVCFLVVGCATKPVPTGVSTRYEGWRQRKNWLKLKRDMTTAEVEEILGAPDRVDLGRGLTYWRYDPEHEGPQAMFNADSMLLEFWKPPEK